MYEFGSAGFSMLSLSFSMLSRVYFSHGEFPNASALNSFFICVLHIRSVVADSRFLQIFEDVSRHRADKYANASLTRAWDRRSGEFKHIAWREV